jgi:hypothetical protein
MQHRELPTPQYLRKVLDYDPDTGILTWKERTKDMFSQGNRRHSWNSRWAGQVAFRKSDFGYMRGSVNGRKVLAHRVIWAMHHGEWPRGQIDHINGDRSDNRIENLREVDAAGNARNHPMHRNNTSGEVGVTWNALRKKWMVRAGKRFVGYFTDLEKAAEARRAAAIEMGFHENHGRRKLE